MKALIQKLRQATVETRECEVDPGRYDSDSWICPFCKETHCSFTGLCQCGAQVQVIATKEIMTTTFPDGKN